MVIKNISNKNAKKNTYNSNNSPKPKDNKIKSALSKKKNYENNERIEKGRKIETGEASSLKKIKMQNLSKLFFSILLAFSIFGSIVWGSLAIYQYATKSAYFALKEIKFSGNKFLTDTELQIITGLELNKNILTYEMNQIETQLLENPWIDYVVIKKSFPDAMHIEIKEREPVFWATKDDNLYYLDKYTNFIAPVSGDKFLLLPTIDIEYANEEAIKLLPQFIDRFEKLELPFSMNELLWFKINPNKGYELYLEKYNLNMSIAIENWEKNMQNLASVILDLEKRRELRKVKEMRSVHNQVTIIKN